MPSPVFPRIRCARCDKPVDGMTTFHDPRDLSIVLEVFCHGDREEMTISARLLHDTPDLQRQILAQEGVAFAAKAIGDARGA